MTWLVNVFYVLGFLAIAMTLGGSFLKSLGSGIRSNEHFGELVLRGGFAAFAIFLWFAFGDSLLSWFFDLFFGSSGQSPTAASVGTSATFASHPFLWLAHLFVYVPIIAAMAVSGIVSFLYNGNTLIDYVLKAVFLSTIVLVFYWRYDGMELLVSWFS